MGERPQYLFLEHIDIKIHFTNYITRLYYLIRDFHLTSQLLCFRIARPILRPRYSALSPVELLQRASAASRLAPATDAVGPVEVIEIIEDESDQVKFTTAPSSPAPSTTTTTTMTSTIPSKARTPSSIPKETKSYRKSYSAGRREQQNPVQQNNAQDLKELLKQSGTLSLSEILQQKNLSLADFLQGKKTALSAIKEQQSAENEVATQKQESVLEVLRFESTKISIVSSTTERSPPPNAAQYAPPRYQQDAPVRAYPDIVYRSPGTTRRPADLYRGTQRSSYLKRTTTTPPPKNFEESERHWLSEDGEKADSREDILELLQPGSPVSLAALLSSRNMTLAELMDHRERGSRQQSLVALFTDLANGVTTTASPRLADSPKRKSKGNRDPRLLDLPRRLTLAPEEAEENETEGHASNIDKVTVEHYDYVEEDEDDEEEPGLPTAVKSAIIASGGLLSVTLALFAAIFLCCRAQQRRHRGSRVPFILRGRHMRTVIKPQTGKMHEDPNDF